MKIITVILFAIGIVVVLLVMTAQNLAQDAPKADAKPAELTPTPAQMKDLKLAQDAAIIATQKLQLLQQQEQQAEMSRQQALAALNAQAEAVKKENKWDEKTVFSANDLTFSAPPKAAEKPAAKP